MYSSDEAEAPDSQSKEDATMIYIDPS